MSIKEYSFFHPVFSFKSKEKKRNVITSYGTNISTYYEKYFITTSR